MAPSRTTGAAPAGLIGRRADVERVVASVLAGPGAVVRGPRGRGCTAVLAEAVRAVRDQGRPLVVLDAVGAPAQPFGALHRVLPGPLPTDVAAATLSDVGEALTAPSAPDAPVVVAVDDLDLVDPATSIVLHQTVTAGRAALLATVRDDAATRDPATAWWLGPVPLVELAPLDRDASDELVERLTGGPVDAASRARLWRLARGHPGWLVAAVSATRAAGAWTRDAGLWSLEGDLATVDPEVLAQVDALPAEVRSVLRALALADRLAIDDAERIGGSGPLAEAERRGLVRVDEGADGVLWCAAATRLVAAALAASSDAAGERAGWERLADVLADSTNGARETALVRGRAVLGAGRARPPVTDDDRGALARGAEAAFLLSRWDDCVALARAAWEAGAGTHPLQLLTLSLGFLGDHTAIAALTDDLADVPEDDDALVSHAETLAISQFHTNDVEQAWATAAAARAAAPHMQAEIDVFESQLRAFRGDHDEALALVDPWRDHPETGLAVPARTVAASIDMNRGRTADAIAAFDAIFAFAMSGPEAPLNLIGTSYLFRLGTVADAGRIEEAIRDATLVESLIVNESDPASHGWLALHLGRCHLRAGRPRTAARWFGEAVSDLRRVHRPGWLAHPAAGLIAAHTAAGDLAAAREAHAAWSEIPPHAVRIFGPEERRYAAWLDVAEGRVAAGAAALREAVDRSRDAGVVPYEAAALHDLSRLGDADARIEAAEGLAELVTRTDSPLLAAHAARATALVTGDAAALVALAGDYTAMGAGFDAAETWAEVVRHAPGEREAAQARRRLADLRAVSEGLVTPLLGGLDAHPVLTEREAEIAAMAVAGVSRQAIADHLVVSVRTIDSHLQRVYRKLGVRGRDELVEVMGDGARADGP